MSTETAMTDSTTTTTTAVAETTTTKTPTTAAEATAAAAAATSAQSTASALAKKRGRVRPHANVNSDSSHISPIHPDQYNWHVHYPTMVDAKTSPNALEKVNKVPTIADIGCGFGGMLLSLSDHFKDECVVGLEIRDVACEIAQEYIDAARATGKVETPRGEVYDWNAPNIGVVNCNMMRNFPNFFAKGQLNKMFILFADPHFKKSKHRNRIINETYLDQYAYGLKIGGILYTITDVEDLYNWQKKHLDEHPLFERIPDEELIGKDVCWELIHMGTHEGVKVHKNKGNKYPACYRRVEYNAEKAKAQQKTRLDLLE